MTDEGRLVVKVCAIALVIGTGFFGCLIGELFGSKPSDSSSGCLFFAILGSALLWSLTFKEQDEDSTSPRDDDPSFGNGG